MAGEQRLKEEYISLLVRDYIEENLFEYDEDLFDIKQEFDGVPVITRWDYIGLKRPLKRDDLFTKDVSKVRKKFKRKKRLKKLFKLESFNSEEISLLDDDLVLEEGMMIYNSTIKNIQYYNGSSWL